jgi:hypothetical protein
MTFYHEGQGPDLETAKTGPTAQRKIRQLPLLSTVLYPKREHGYGLKQQYAKYDNSLKFDSEIPKSSDLLNDLVRSFHVRIYSLPLALRSNPTLNHL